MTYLEEVNGKHITVRNVEYTIEVLPEVEIYQKAGQEVFGCASYKDSKIYLCETMNDDRAYQTFIHELLHVMFFESGHIFENEQQEEQIVNSLSLLMYDMIHTGHLTLELDSVDPEIVAMLADENDNKIYLDSVESMEINGEEQYTKPQPLFKLPKLFKDKPKQDTDDKDFYYVETAQRLFKISAYQYGCLLESTHIFQFYDHLTSSYFDIPVSSITNVSKVVPFKEEN